MNRSPHGVSLSIVRAVAHTLIGRRRAEAWLAAPNTRLGGDAPPSLAGDLRGAERVLAELNRVGGRRDRQQGA